MLKIAVSGAGGRMGREVAIAALGDSEIAIVGAAEASGSAAIGADIASLCGLPPLGISLTDDIRAALSSAEVLVEFTIPAATVEHVGIAAELGKAVVVGTTGLAPADAEAVRAAARRIPIVMAPNMSVGVNALLQALPEIARVLGSGYDVEIVEAHHRGKKDAPSGTALELAAVIADALDRDLNAAACYGRHGVAPRREGEIGIHALRAGAIVGDHRVTFTNEGEQIEIAHRAFSRQTFALGALRAAKFVARQRPGLFTMHDVLG